MTVAVAVHLREGRCKHARVNLHVLQLQMLTAEEAWGLIGTLAASCGG